MAKLQAHPKRKSTGGKYHYLKGKRKALLGNELLELTIGAKKVKKMNGRSRIMKDRAMLLKEANVLDPKTGKFQKAEIITVKENPANPHFVRRNTITKGAVLLTNIGLVKVTSRPGQTGSINAVIVGAHEIPKTPALRAEKEAAAKKAAEPAKKA